MEVHEQGTDWNDYIQPENLLNVDLCMAVGKVKQDLFNILKTEDFENPFQLAQEMAMVPVWQAYFGSLLAHAESNLAEATRFHEEWMALAYEVARKRLINERGDNKFIVTDIKQAVPRLMNQTADWIITDPDGKSQTITLLSYKEVVARLESANLNVSLMKTYCKAIQSKIDLLPSQLALAKRIYETPQYTVPENVGQSGPQNKSAETK